MIKYPINFVLGIVCALCFFVCIIQGKDLFTIIFCLVSAIANLVGSTRGGKK